METRQFIWRKIKTFLPFYLFGYLCTLAIAAFRIPIGRFDRFRTMDELLAFAEGKTARGHEREGVVFKSTDAPYASFKAVSNRYLLKND